MSMAKKNLAGMGAVVVAAACTAAALLAQPASAATATAVTVTYHGIEVQVDNSPGNGAPGWVWVYAGPDDGYVPNKSGTIEYVLQNGQTGSLTVSVGNANSESTDSPVSQFQACAVWEIEDYPFESCSGWYSES
jgi:hypothetical protein